MDFCPAYVFSFVDSSSLTINTTKISHSHGGFHCFYAISIVNILYTLIAHNEHFVERRRRRQRPSEVIVNPGLRAITQKKSIRR